jgi:hypothetical protein
LIRVGLAALAAKVRREKYCGLNPPFRVNWKEKEKRWMIKIQKNVRKEFD